MLQLGQVLKGRLSSYKLTQQLQKSVWLAVNQQVEQNVIVKYAEHWRVRNERDILRRFQSRTQHIRPLVDEVEPEQEGGWPALVLKWLEDDVLNTCSTRQLTQAEIKRVGRGVLEALQVLHEDGFVHTDVKPSNILVNYDPGDKQITDVQLGDLEYTLHRDSKHARESSQISTPIFRSPEAILQLPWNTSTDVWSFGTTMISLIYGAHFHIFMPDVPVDDEMYEVKILMRQNEFFGPFPPSYVEIAGEDSLESLQWVMENTVDSLKPFHQVSNREVSEVDKKFLLKIMKLDPRDRPTVQELLADEWFTST